MPNYLKKVYFLLFKFSVLIAHYLYNKKSQKYYHYFLSKNNVKFNGYPKYIGLTSMLDNHGVITLSKDVVISEEVVLLTHDYSPVNPNKEFNNKVNGYPWIGDITIGENSFIGIRALILPNTIIGKNCIIGAGSVVKGNIPDNSIFAGNPAKYLCKTSEWIYKKNMQYEQIHLKGTYSLIKVRR